MIFHITSQAEWSQAQTRGEYAAPSLVSEGFIHFSTDKQVLTVANAFYRGRKDLVVLQVGEARLKPVLMWEAPAGPPADNISESDLFPHVYGPVNLDAVIAVLEFQPDPATGMFDDHPHE